MQRTSAYARREFLGAGVATLGWFATRKSFAQSGKQSSLKVLQASPFNAEGLAEKLTANWSTPTELLFARCHGKKLPEVDAKTFRLKVEGLVEKPLDLSLEELGKLGRTSKQHVTITCAGNRRVEHSRTKAISGVQWDIGAIGNAQWEGVALRDVLAAAGVKAEAKHVWFEGLDEVEHDGVKTAFGGSIPLAKLAEKELPVLLATRMNDAPLTVEHGFPLRAVVPGYIGARSVKWLGKIVVSDKPSPNFFIAGTYKIVKTDAPAEMAKAEPIYENVLNSAICLPTTGAKLKAGRTTLSGFALPSGKPMARIAKVELRIDGGRWETVKLDNADQPYCWALWSRELDLAAGTHTLTVRASDSLGNTQPEKVEWNAKGYLYNAWHSVTVEVA